MKCNTIKNIPINTITDDKTIKAICEVNMIQPKKTKNIPRPR